MSKIAAPGKGLRVMCQEAYSLGCHHWCMRGVIRLCTVCIHSMCMH